MSTTTAVLAWSKLFDLAFVWLLFFSVEGNTIGDIGDTLVEVSEADAPRHPSSSPESSGNNAPQRGSSQLCLRYFALSRCRPRTADRLRNSYNARMLLVH